MSITQQPLPPPANPQLVHPPDEMLPSTSAETPLHPRPPEDVTPETYVPLKTASATKDSHWDTEIVPAVANRQLMRGDRNTLSTSDESAMMRQILAYHDPDGRDLDVKPLLRIIEDIVHRAKHVFPTIGAEPHIDAWDDKGIHSGFTRVPEPLEYPINKTSSEIICKCSAGGDGQSITMALFQSLSSYSWEAKVSICFAAFAMNCDEFWLVAQLHSTNPLAKSFALLMELPEIMEHREALKKNFDAINRLVNAMLEMTRCIFKFKDLPTQHISPESPEMIAADALVPRAVHWTIRSIVACSSLLMNLIALGHECMTSAAEAWELSSLAHKLANIKEQLERQIHLCNQKIEENRQNDALYALVRLFETPHLDNMKILRALIYAEEDQLLLYDGTHRKRASLDVLRRKNVLLLISGLDVSSEELIILHEFYAKAKSQPTRTESQYEVVWLPVVDRSTPWTDTKQNQFERVQNSMPWYSVAHPSLLHSVVLRFIKEIWGFVKKPQLVVLDPQGKESNRNAIHMMWIWGSSAIPFTKAKEEALWREETWTIEFLIDGIDVNILFWISENRYICLYGGEDVDWIRRFTVTARKIAIVAHIPLEMLYVGKSNPKERVRWNNIVIQTENLSHILPDLTSIWFFWARLESMWHSKVQLGLTVQNDPIMQEIITMLSFDGSDQSWAVFCRGSHEMAKGRGELVLDCLNNYDYWKESIVYPDGFVIALNEQLHQMKTPYHSSRLILPETTRHIPEKVVCVECGRPMEKFVMYCCSKY